MVKVRKKMYTYMHHVQFCEDSEFKMAHNEELGKKS